MALQSVDMDELLAEIPRDALRDGFTGQRMLVVPRPAVRRALQQPMTDQLMVTDAGFFPHAARHGRSRPDGGAENIVLLCTDGLGWARVDDAQVTVRAGDAVVVPARTSHEYAAAETDPWTPWWFHFVGGYSRSAVEAARSAAGGPVTHSRDSATSSASHRCSTSSRSGWPTHECSWTPPTWPLQPSHGDAGTTTRSTSPGSSHGPTAPRPARTASAPDSEPAVPASPDR